MRSVTRRTALLLAAAAAAPFRMKAANAEPPTRDIFSTFASDPRFGDWTTLLLMSGLARFAQSSAQFTVFAPTNEAFYGNPTVFQELVPDNAETMPDTSTLIRFVRAHVLAGIHQADEIMGKQVTLRSLAGSALEIDGREPKMVKITWSSLDGRTGSATLSEAPIRCTNGLIYPLDRIALT